MELKEVYKSIPSFTKVYLGMFILDTWAISFGLAEESTFEMNYSMMFTRFQLWRMFTWFAFWKGFSITFLILIVITHVCISTIENYYRRRIHDFYYMLFFVFICHTILGWVLETSEDMMTEFLCTLMYIYCRREPEDNVQVFGVLIQTKYFPWIWIVLCKLSGYEIIKIVAGYTVGHLYDYLRFILPETFGWNWLETPNWFKWAVNKVAAKMHKMRERPQQQANEVRWGNGAVYKLVWRILGGLSL